MKRSLALLLASFLVVFGLTACGSDEKTQNQDKNDNAVIDGDNTENGTHNGLTGQQDPGGSGTDTDSNQNHTDDSLMDDAEQGMEDVKDGVEDAVQDTKDALDDAADNARTRNAYPHDKDGDLTDQENGFSRNSLL